MRQLSSLLVGILLLAVVSSAGAANSSTPTVLVVVGVGGAPEYEKQFATWADQWQATAAKAEAKYVEIGRSDDADSADRDRLKKTLETHAKESTAPLWMVMIGHGTFFRNVAKFNLRGSDVSAAELAVWLQPIERQVVVVNCASSSGPFINRLSGPNRIVITGTKSGVEQNFARFGEYFSRAISDSKADLDHDDEVSLLEAFLSASGQVAKFYEQEGRLPTEQALIDDNGDQAGTPASFFRGIRAQAKAKDGKTLDGLKSRRVHLALDASKPAWSDEQLAERSRLETAIESLRSQRQQLGRDAYYEQLETLLVPLAKLYAQVEASASNDKATSDESQ